MLYKHRFKVCVLLRSQYSICGETRGFSNVFLTYFDYFFVGVNTNLEGWEALGEGVKPPQPPDKSSTVRSRSQNLFLNLLGQPKMKTTGCLINFTKIYFNLWKRHCSSTSKSDSKSCTYSDHSNNWQASLYTNLPSRNSLRKEENFTIYACVIDTVQELMNNLCRMDRKMA